MASRTSTIECINCGEVNYERAEACENCGYDGWPFRRP
jgi:ribosomal protein L37E